MKKFFYILVFVFASVISFDKISYADACDNAMDNVRQLWGEYFSSFVGNILIDTKKNESKELLKEHPNDTGTGRKIQENKKGMYPALAMVKSACVNADKKKMDDFNKEYQAFFQKMFKASGKLLRK